jgi:hypothetical protein
VRAIEVKQAKRRLPAYAKMAYEAPVLLTSAGKPYVVMTRAAEADLEDLAVGSSPAFRAIMERSEARYRAEGGLSTEAVPARRASSGGAAAGFGTQSAEEGRRQTFAGLSRPRTFFATFGRTAASSRGKGSAVELWIERAFSSRAPSARAIPSKSCSGVSPSATCTANSNRASPWDEVW